MPLLEPLGLLHGAAAAEAMRAGLACPLAGGPTAFSLARLHEDSDGPEDVSSPRGRIVAVGAVPPRFHAALGRVTAAPPRWAGLPTDRPLVMGVVNVTPDSFSDGGAHFDPSNAIAAGRRMAAEGADVIDVGGESTRPGSSPTDPDTERARVLPVIRALAEAGLVVSVDTRNAATMDLALDAGARIVNDVSGLSHDAAAPDLIRRRGCPVVVMHMRGTPLTMQSLADYDDVAVDVTRELAARLAALGLAPGQAAVDPGIGFAKAAGQNEALLARLPLLHGLACRILIGVSRKGFIGRIVGATNARDRGPGSIAAVLAALPAASILRVHDVAATVQAVRVAEAVRSAD